MAFTFVSIGDVCGVFSSQLCRKYWKKLLDDGEEPTSRMYQKTWRKKKHFTVLSCGRSHFWTRLHSDSRVFSIQGPAALNLKVCLGVAEPKQYGRRGYGMWRLWVIRGWGRNGSCRHLWGREEKPTNRLECLICCQGCIVWKTRPSMWPSHCNQWSHCFGETIAVCSASSLNDR